MVPISPRQAMMEPCRSGRVPPPLKSVSSGCNRLSALSSSFDLYIVQSELLGDRYQLQDPIDRDGMSVVYRALDLRTDHIVAIKVLRDIYSTDAKFVARFQREAKAMSSLQHPNIVQFYDYGQAIIISSSS